MVDGSDRDRKYLKKSRYLVVVVTGNYFGVKVTYLNMYGSR